MKILFLTFKLFIFLGCRNHSHNGKIRLIRPIEDSIQSQKIEKVESKQKFMEVDCTRGIPKPAIDSLVFPSRKFQLTNSTSAIEIFINNEGEKIIVTHGGCESYVLTFRFETSRFKSETNDLLYWYKRTTSLLNEIEAANISPIDMDAGIDALVNYIDPYTEKNLDEIIYISESELPEYITLNGIEKIDSSKFSIEVSFVIGPL